MQEPSTLFPERIGPAEEESAWLRLPFDRIGFVLGPVVLVGWLYGVDPGPLSPEGHRFAGIMLFTILWWLTEPIPIPATALAAIVLCVVLRAVPASVGLQGLLAKFADPSVFFLLGGLFIGRAMIRHGLDRRLALSLLCTGWAGQSPSTVLAGVGVSVMLISMWISNTAATAMMYPITLGIIAVLSQGGPKQEQFARSPYASGLLLMTAYASSVGGIATPIGTATNVLAFGYIRRPEYLGQPIDFLRWTLLGVPTTVCIMIGLHLWLHVLMPKSTLDVSALRSYLREEFVKLGTWKRGEVNTLCVFLIVVTLWVTPGVLAVLGLTDARQAFVERFPEEITAMIAPVLLFLVPIDIRSRTFCLEAGDFTRLDWGTILLFGSGLALGHLMFETGLAQVLGQELFDAMGTRDVWILTAVAIGAGILLSEFTGNAAAAATLLPVVLSICRQAQIDPLPPLLGVTLAASFGSALPVSTPPNAIVYSSGLLPMRRMIQAGIGLDVICAVLIWIVLRVAWLLQWTPFAAV